MYLKKPSFHRTDFSPSWSHKSDSLPNFGVNSTTAADLPYSARSPTVGRPPLPDSRRFVFFKKNSNILQNVDKK
jgi:hypothetical protein